MKAREKLLNTYLAGIANYNRARSRYDYKDNLVVLGCPRGGTTWVAELFATQEVTSTLYEPLGLYIPMVQQLKLNRWQYVPEGAQWDELKNYLTDLLRGEYLSSHVLLEKDTKTVFGTKRWVTKFIKGNMILPWLTKNFPLEKVVLVVRHPCAVVASQLKFRGSEQFVNDIFNYPLENQKYPDLYRQFENELKDIETIEEKLAASWCLANYVPFKKGNDKRWLTIYYEELLMGGEDAVREMFEKLNMEITDEIIKSINRPSYSSIVGKSTVLSTKKQLEKWKTTLCADQINQVEKVVDKFNMNIYKNHYEIDENFSI